MNQEIRLDLQQSKIRIFQGIVTLKSSGLSVQKKQNPLMYLSKPKVKQKKMDELSKIF